MWLQVAVCVLLVWTTYAQNVPKLRKLRATYVTRLWQICAYNYTHHKFCAEKYNVTAADTSISGLSSGGYMAVQFHVAFSETLRGAGITAGGMVL